MGDKESDSPLLPKGDEIGESLNRNPGEVLLATTFETINEESSLSDADESVVSEEKADCGDDVELTECRSRSTSYKSRSPQIFSRVGKPPTPQRSVDAEHRRRNSSVSFYTGDEPVDVIPASTMNTLLRTEKSEMKCFIDREEVSTIELYVFEKTSEWVEAARFIKYEELVIDQNSFGPPRVPFSHYHVMDFLKRSFDKASILTDAQGQRVSSMEELADRFAVEFAGEDRDLMCRIAELLKRKQRSIHHGHRAIGERHPAGSGRLPRPSVVAAADVRRMVQSRSASHDIAGMRSRRSQDAVANLGERRLPQARTFSVFTPRISAGSDLLPVQAVPDPTAQNQAKQDESFKEIVQIYVAGAEGMNRCRMVMMRLEDGIVDKHVVTKEFYCVLGPADPDVPFFDIGRALGTLLSNTQFKAATLTATTGAQLAQAFNYFIDDTIILPPGAIDSKQLIHQEPIKQKMREIAKKRTAPRAPRQPTSFVKEEEAIMTTKKRGPFSGMIDDCRRRFPQYWSDIKDAYHSQCVTCIFFIILAAMSPSITFGGLIGQYTNDVFGIMEVLYAQFLANLIWSLVACQPLIIQSPTGPVLIFEASLYLNCETYGEDFMTVRLLAGVTVLILCFIVAYADLAKLLHMVTRFSEDIFSAMISFIFMIESGRFLLDTYYANPTLSFVGYIETREVCNATLDHMKPNSCAEPNTFLLSVLLLSATFGLSIAFRVFRNGKFLNTRLRNFIGDFGVGLAICIVSLIYQVFFSSVYVKRLEIPDTLSFTKISARGHGLIVNPMGHISLSTLLISTLAGCLIFILLALETGITELLLLRKDRHLTKGGGLHSDMLLMGIMTFILSLLGLPWMCAAAVQSGAHVNALTIHVKRAPGQREGVVRVIEQRITTLAIAIVILFVILGGNILRIPMACLFGVFFYLGTMNLSGVQLLQRSFLLFTPKKFFPPRAYANGTTVRKMRAYTVAQTACVIVIMLVKLYQRTSTIFPLVLIAFIVVRKWILPFFYNEKELEALDGEENDIEEEEDDYNFYSHAPIPT